MEEINVYIKKVDPELYEIINREQNREHDTLELIASENFTSPAILEAAGGIMTINMQRVILVNVIMVDAYMLMKLKI